MGAVPPPANWPSMKSRLASTSQVDLLKLGPKSSCARQAGMSGSLEFCWLSNKCLLDLSQASGEESASPHPDPSTACAKEVT